MPTKMNCPQCGADLRIEDGETRVKCPYCGTSITISAETNVNISDALGMLGNIPGMSELMDKAMQLKRVKELLNAGQKIEAIKAYRDITGLGLAEAKEAVEVLERGQPLMMGGNKAVQILSQIQTTSGNIDPEVLEQIKSLVKSGNKIEAIKLLREHLPMGLKEAKDMVDAHAAGAPLVTTSSVQALTPVSQISDADFMAEIKNLLRRNKKIDAIKLYRERYNVGLKEAKDAVEAMEMGVMPQQTPSFSQSPPASFQPAFTPSEPVISANPFDRDENKGSGCNWIAIGIGLLALLLLGACLAL